jgi:hypothetical protein
MSGYTNGHVCQHTQNASEVPNEKLRSTCDSCASSKVRCNKQKPACRRCMTLKLDCLYGQSRRKGKPSFKGPKCVNQVPQLIESQGSACATPQIALPPTPQSLTPQSLNWWTQPEFCENFTGLPLAAVGDNIHSEDMDMLNDSQWNYKSEPMTGSHDASGSDLSSMMTEDSSINKAQNLAFPSPLDISCTLLPDLADFSGNITPNPDHICTLVALDTLKDLYQHRRQSSNNIQMTITGPASDQILHTNRKAVQSLEKVLSCDCDSCHQDSNIYFLLATICSKVLAKYRAVFNGIMLSDHPYHNPSGRSSASSNEEAVSITSITIGDFKLDPVAETKMKAQLLLCELQNSGKVFDLLSHRNGGTPNNDRSSERGVNKAFEQYLRSSLTDLVTRLDQFCVSRN